MNFQKVSLEINGNCVTQELIQKLTKSVSRKLMVTYGKLKNNFGTYQSGPWASMEFYPISEGLIRLNPCVPHLKVAHAKELAKKLTWQHRN